MSPIKKLHAPRTWCHITIAAVSFLLLLLAAGGWAGWIARQSRRIETLLQAANSAEAVRDWTSPETHLRGCLKFRSEDAALCVHVAGVIEKGAISEQDRRRAIPFYAKSLRLDPNNHDVRLSLADPADFQCAPTRKRPAERKPGSPPLSVIHSF